MANIAIGKIGQKLIFDRDSEAGTRSNTNGNFAAYSLFKLLIEKNPNDTFYIIGDNDLDTLQVKLYENAIDAKYFSLNDIDDIGIDFAIFMVGIVPLINSNEKIIEVVNNIPIRWLLISDDPRCLRSFSVSNELYSYPEDIISQTNTGIMFNNKFYNTKYVPIEAAVCYNYTIPEYKSEEKEYNMIVVSNTTKGYNRTQIIHSLIGGLNIPLIGRLSEEDKEKFNFKNYIGEVKHEESLKLLRKSLTTLAVPIDYKHITSKYVEALMNNCLPIFFETYGHDLLGNISRSIIVEDRHELEWVYNNILHDKEYYYKMLLILQQELIIPHFDGSIINNEIMKLIR